VVDGRFELLERLGSGGMGTVWRALDLGLQREVALKEVRPGGGEQPDVELAGMYRERVLREARALARIDHPNVVTIHQIIDAPDMPYPWLVMELVRGESLQDRLARGVMTPVEAARMGRGVLAALQAAHRAGICHRDIKPGNVLLRTDGSPVLTDFGIAVIDDVSRVTATGGLVGSPEYIAPERLHGREGDPASDLWSLGMLLYVAVEGHNPVRRTTLAATLAAVMTSQIPAPRQAGPLTGAIGALLVPDPAARPDAETLDRMLAEAEGPTTLPPVPAPAFPPPAFPAAAPGPMTPPPTPWPGAGAAHPAAVPTVPAIDSRRPPRQRSLLPGVAAAGILIVALVFFSFSRMPFLNGDGAGVEPTAPGFAPGAPTAALESGTKKAATLLTTEGVLKSIDAFEAATGRDKFTSFLVYEEYAVAEVPVPGRSQGVDRHIYRDGKVTRMGSGTSREEAVSPRVFDWKVLPDLLRAADDKLNVPTPKSRYIVMEPAWTFADDKPTLLVYLSDEYGGGYLAADAKGKIVHVNAAD